MRILVLALSLMLASTAHAQETGSIRGWVGDPLASPLPGASVTVTTADGVRAASSRTDDSGTFVVERIAKGPYLVAIESLGFVRAEARVYVGADATTRIATLLSIGDWAKRWKSPTIRGTVLDALGSPVEGAWVRAIPIAPTRPSRDDQVVATDARGQFELAAELHEIYVFLAIAPGQLATVMSHPGPGGVRKAVELRLQRLPPP